MRVQVAGKSVSLVHPFTMIFLFGFSLWTGWLGLQWRCVRARMHQTQCS